MVASIRIGVVEIGFLLEPNSTVTKIIDLTAQLGTFLRSVYL
jgi:hypothetical protein